MRVNLKVPETLVQVPCGGASLVTLLACQALLPSDSVHGCQQHNLMLVDSRQWPQYWLQSCCRIIPSIRVHCCYKTGIHCR